MHTIESDNGKTADFYTAKFEKEDELVRRVERVFWSLNHPETNQWEAPDGARGARRRYGLARALYKLYFTSGVGLDEDTIEASAAVDFAEVMLPEIDAALFPVAGANEGDAPATAEAPNAEATTAPLSAEAASDASDALEADLAADAIN